MQKIEEAPFKLRLTPRLMKKLIDFLWRYRSHPEALEPFLASFQQIGVPEQNISNTRMILTAWRDVYHDKKATYRVDRYLVSGIGAADLVLLPVVLPMGISDRSLFIALLSLAISLSFVSCSLLVSFIKDGLGILSYGKVHSIVITLSLVFGVVALIAAFWHVSPLVGIVFLCLIIPLYIACAGYFVFARIVVGFLQILQSTSNADSSKVQQESTYTDSPG